jgi:hypothetical protein
MTAVAGRLNGPVPAQTSGAEARARSALLELEHSSSEINKRWPSEEGFHVEVLVLHTAILIRMSYRGQAKLVLFGSCLGQRCRGCRVAPLRDAAQT